MEHWSTGLTREEVEEQLDVLGIKTRNVRALLNKYVLLGIVDQAQRRGGWMGRRGVRGLYDHNSALQIYRVVFLREEMGLPLRLVKSTVMESPVRVLYSVSKKTRRLKLRFGIRINVDEESRRRLKYVSDRLYDLEFKRVLAAKKKLERWYGARRT